MTRHFARLSVTVLPAIALAACASTSTPAPASPTGAATAPIAVPTGATLSELFDKYDAAQLSLSPEGKASRGIRDGDYGRWSPGTDESEVAAYTLTQATARAMRDSFDRSTLSPADQLSFDLFDAMAKRQASLFPFRDHGYVFDQMNGAQSSAPAFLINIHRVADVAEARAYISRIAGIGPALDQQLANSERAAARGILPPRWVYPYVIGDIDNLTDGKAVLEDFGGKVDRLAIADAEKARLKADAAAAWRDAAAPAYRRLRTAMAGQQARAGTDDGVWRLPDGGAYYRALLKSYTTTDMTPEQIHQLGLSEVARIHGEMRTIMAKVGFKGTLPQFFEEVRTNPRFYATSREEYLAKTDVAIKGMEAALPRFFKTLPKAALQVKAVEAFREKSAGKAFYSRPAPDGSRPGIYYVNLYNLKDMALTELEALAYHEGVPGHHLQLAVQTELADVPPFRRFGGVTAYSEGWGLYSETLAKDMGFYTDPYSDFGRLAMELWRACRLVTDTGIHDKRWSREKAIAYLQANTPNPKGDIEKAIERYIVYPGQATAYTIGKVRIMELRERARRSMGDRFDIREFHEVVLRSGPVPLDLLERRVLAWAEGGR